MKKKKEREENEKGLNCLARYSCFKLYANSLVILIIHKMNRSNVHIPEHWHLLLPSLYTNTTFIKMQLINKKILHYWLQILR